MNNFIEKKIESIREKYAFRDNHQNLTMPHWWPVVENELRTALQEAYSAGEKYGRTETAKWAKESWIPQARSQALQEAIEIGEGLKVKEYEDPADRVGGKLRNLIIGQYQRALEEKLKENK